MKQLIVIFENPIFLSGIFSWLFCQVLKTIISIVRKKPTKFKDVLLSLLWTTGGMPSSHSAVVSSLATSVGFEWGVNTPIFAVSFFYAFITIRDALGVRRAAGSQAIAINQLLSELSEKFDLKVKPVKEIHGHRTSEVTVGIILGFFIAVAFCNL